MDVVAAFEDAFEVDPCSLDLYPNTQHRISHSQLVLQFQCLVQEVSYMLALNDILELNLQDGTIKKCVKLNSRTYFVKHLYNTKQDKIMG